VKKTFLYNWLH